MTVELKFKIIKRDLIRVTRASTHRNLHLFAHFPLIGAAKPAVQVYNKNNNNNNIIHVKFNVF